MDLTRLFPVTSLSKQVTWSHCDKHLSPETLVRTASSHRTIIWALRLISAVRTMRIHPFVSQPRTRSWNSAVTARQVADKLRVATWSPPTATCKGEFPIVRPYCWRLQVDLIYSSEVRSLIHHVHLKFARLCKSCIVLISSPNYLHLSAVELIKYRSIIYIWNDHSRQVGSQPPDSVLGRARSSFPLPGERLWQSVFHDQRPWFTL